MEIDEIKHYNKACRLDFVDFNLLINHIFYF
jgi:hypothetical protein